MKIRLTERDLNRIVNRVLKEQKENTFNVVCGGCELPSKIKTFANYSDLPGTFYIMGNDNINYRSGNLEVEKITEEDIECYERIQSDRAFDMCYELYKRFKYYIIDKKGSNEERDNFEAKEQTSMCHSAVKIQKMVKGSDEYPYWH